MVEVGALKKKKKEKYTGMKMSKEELQMYLHFKRRGFTLPNRKREFKEKHKKNYLNEE